MINSLGIERLGESNPRDSQGMSKGVEPFDKLRINFSEPSMRCPRKKGAGREVAISSQKLQGGALRKYPEDIFSERASWREAYGVKINVSININYRDDLFIFCKVPISPMFVLL